MEETQQEINIPVEILKEVLDKFQKELQDTLFDWFLEKKLKTSIFFFKEFPLEILGEIPVEILEKFRQIFLKECLEQFSKKKNCKIHRWIPG